MTTITVKQNAEQPAGESQPANENPTVTDSRGRVLRLKRPNALAQYRLVDALGPSAENRVYLSMCIPLIYVSEIDGEPVSQPSTKLQVEALIQRLDDPGLLALNAGVAQHFSSDEQEVTRAKK